jgi:hypothetical protein
VGGLEFAAEVGSEAAMERKVAEAEAGMPVTMSRLCSPLVKDETLNALRSDICAGADQIVLEVPDDGDGGRGGDGEGVANVITGSATVSVVVPVTMSVVVVVVVQDWRGKGVVEKFEERICVDRADEKIAELLARGISEEVSKARA